MPHFAAFSTNMMNISVVAQQYEVIKSYKVPAVCCTGSNHSAETKMGPWSFKVATLPAAPLYIPVYLSIVCHFAISQLRHNSQFAKMAVYGFIVILIICISFVFF